MAIVAEAFLPDGDGRRLPELPGPTVVVVRGQRVAADPEVDTDTASTGFDVAVTTEGACSGTAGFAAAIRPSQQLTVGTTISRSTTT